VSHRAQHQRRLHTAARRVAVALGHPDLLVDAKALAERQAAALGTSGRADPVDAAALVGLAAQQNGRAVTYADVAVPWTISEEV